MERNQGARANGLAAERIAQLRQRFPTVDDMRSAAQRRVPRFAFDFVDGGAGDEICLRRNRSSLNGIELVPHCSLDTGDVSTEVELFGRRYAAPFGIAPMGAGGMMWPGAELMLAPRAQAANVPYTLATPANASIETIAALAPDVFWFQLYRFAGNDHKITFDLVDRAQAAGAHVLLPTVDSPSASKRPRDMRNGVRLAYKPGIRTFVQSAQHPAWSQRLLNNGIPKLESMVKYVGPDANYATTSQFMTREGGGSHTWDELARLRDRWKRAFVVKGILHPEDAERAVKIGADGVVVSNHGGRHFDAAPASIDVLPAIVEAVGSRMTVLMDSGIRTGLDIVRALALGAKAVLIGRPFLYGVAAIGPDGAQHVISMYLEDIASEFRHVGVHSVTEAAMVPFRHPTAWRFGIN